MKTIIKKSGLLLIGMLITIVSLAQSNRVLTEPERQSLLGSSAFLEKCQWAVRDYATYWSGHDGSGLSTESDRINWAKDRQLSISILKNGVNDSHLVEVFLNASKGREFLLNASPESVSTLVSAWDSSSAFEEFVAQYFRILGDNINFSLD